MNHTLTSLEKLAFARAIGRVMSRAVPKATLAGAGQKSMGLFGKPRIGAGAMVGSPKGLTTGLQVSGKPFPNPFPGSIPFRPAGPVAGRVVSGTKAPLTWDLGNFNDYPLK